ncbi:MAG: endolytic transglycosylase MltG [Clostridia bacterium]|nr:endolytic transglycosylase MltG [Clostridia bacterium]
MSNNDYNIDDFLKNFDRNLDNELKNAGNQNKKNNVQSNSYKDSFSVHIDRSKDFVDDEEGYIPAYNGEIYFANHTPLRPKEEPAEDKKPAEKKKAKKHTKQIPINVAEGTAAGAAAVAENGKITPAMVVKAAGIRLKRKFNKGAAVSLPQKASDRVQPVNNGADDEEATKEIAFSKSGKNRKSNIKSMASSGVKALKKKYRKRGVMAVGICVVLAVIISFVAISCINDILAIGRDSEKIYTVTIPADASTSSVIRILDKQGLIKNSIFCNIIAKVQHFRSDNYIPGIYYVTESMGLEGMLLQFKSAQVTGEEVRLTFPEGYNVDQIMAKLEKYEVCSTALFKQTLRDVDFSKEYDFLASIKDKDQRYIYVEGYLYPDTYDFYVGENPAAVIRKFLDNFKEKWTEEYQEKAKKINMSMDEVITLASIIQKEAYGAEQMPDVSSVIHNRLNYSALFPTLKCDCTQYYVKNFIEKNTADRSLAMALNNRYNTNDCIGLPIGAICNPGDDAINAALNPNETKYYFFAHDNNNKIYLASNESDHNKNLIEINEVNKSAKKD